MIRFLIAGCFAAAVLVGSVASGLAEKKQPDADSETDADDENEKSEKEDDADADEAIDDTKTGDSGDGSEAGESEEKEEKDAELDDSEPLARGPMRLGDLSYRLIGYLRLEAALVQADPDVSFVGRSDGFRLQNARIGVEGTWREQLTVRITADGAREQRANPNDTEGTLGFELADAYGDVHVTSAFDVRVARFRPVFDIERLTSPSRRGFVRRALSSEGVHPTEGFERSGLTVLRNLGVALRSNSVTQSDSFALGFELAVQNGNGPRAAANDNDSFAYSAAVFATVSEVLWASAAARYNRRSEVDLPFSRTEDDFEAAASVRLERKPIRATAQVLARRTDFRTTGGAARNALGFHAEALLAIPGASWLEAGYRFSILEPSDLDPFDRVQEHTIGVNVDWPAARGRLQLNATHAIEQAGQALDNSRVEAALQVSL